MRSKRLAQWGVMLVACWLHSSVQAQTSLPFGRGRAAPAEAADVADKTEKSAQPAAGADAAASGTITLKPKGREGAEKSLSAAEDALRSAIKGVHQHKGEILIRTGDWTTSETGSSKTAKESADKKKAKDEKPAKEEKRDKHSTSTKEPSAKAAATAARPARTPLALATQSAPAESAPAKAATGAGAALCEKGRLQSPIPIDSSEAHTQSPGQIAFSYAAVSVRVDASALANAVANSHPRLLSGPDAFIESRGRIFYLESIEFRLPGEERVDDRAPILSVHLHHRAADGKRAVVAVPVVEGGVTNAGLAHVWQYLFASEAARPAAAVLDLESLLPDTHAAFSYVGSLTQPPCTEGVVWFVMRDAITMTREQLAVYAGKYAPNARELQPRGDRMVMFSRP